MVSFYEKSYYKTKLAIFTDFESEDRIESEIRQRKINFLFDEAYQYFYDLLETPKVADVDLPEFIYEEQRKRVAWEKASKALLDVFADGRLNECYSRRMKELKN